MIGHAQPRHRLWRIGFLYPARRELATKGIDSFRQAFSELGYVEGRDYVFEIRAEGNPDRMPGAVVDLMSWGPDLILAIGSPMVRAAQQATRTIPIVMVSAADPVGSGVVKSLASPGGNVTGMSNSLTDIAPKLLDLVHDAVPGVARVAVLMNPRYEANRAALASIQESARRIGVGILPIHAELLPEVEKGFALAARQGARAVIVLLDDNYEEMRQQCTDLALKHKLAGITPGSGWATGGFLLGYGPSVLALCRQAATYVDKILKGAKPRDLPVGQPTTFELTINLKTAKTLGLKTPESILLRADRVIE